MLQRLLSSLTLGRSQVAPVGAIPPGQRVYAIGDIHGRLDLLDKLLEQIKQDRIFRGPAETTIIFLGDLVDRGPDSAQVVERLRKFRPDQTTVRFLLGNHEEVFLKALAGEKGALPFFIRIGGKATILSYDISEAEYLAASYPALQTLLQARVPRAHIDFLSSFEDLIIIGDYAFVHAGVDPTSPLADQKSTTFRWIRDDFINHRGLLEKIVVHGHTISDSVEERSHRIGIDTGAFASGRLTAIGLERSNRWYLKTC